jgi:deoxyhypusine synthase
MDCSELINFFGRTGYNARRLAEAAATVREMIDSDSTICLTLAGAMTPRGLGKTIATMIEHGFRAWIVRQGQMFIMTSICLIYGPPGHYDVDDDLLYEINVRI